MIQQIERDGEDSALHAEADKEEAQASIEKLINKMNEVKCHNGNKQYKNESLGSGVKCCCHSEPACGST